MANYLSSGGHAMRTECPHCGSFAEHKQVKSDPKHYRYSDAAEALFRDRCGRDISYRRRTRECSACQGWFDTIELEQKFLFKLIDSMLEDQERAREAAESLRDAELDIERLKQKQNDVAARVMNTMAELRDPALSRRGLTVVPTARPEHDATVQ